MGARKGNKNALKHGFYSRAYREGEISDLELTNLEGVKDEIKLQKIIIRRIMERFTNTPDMELREMLDTLNAVSNGNSVIGGLLKTDLALNSQDELGDALEVVLRGMVKK